MIRKIKLSVIATALTLSTGAMADSKSVNSIEEMFSEGEVSGQIRLGHISYDTKVAGSQDTSATAIGGQLKFETASFKGFSIGAAAYTSQDIKSLSGDQGQGEFATDLSSSERNYTEMAEAYINYANGGFNFRGGRQLIDTPLADSDDIRMTPHTFEAYVASYSFEDLGLTFIGANLQRWQGVDSDFANVTSSGWAETGVDGTWMGAAVFEKDNIAAGVWYYDVDKAAKAIYADISYTMEINSDIAITVAAQYLTESESDNSGIDGSIAGAMVEAGIGSLTLAGAYNSVSVDDGKQIFEGFGGGSSYTNIDTNTAGFLHDGTSGDGESYVLSAGYEIAGVNLIAAYGDYKADALSNGTGKQHATEINLGAEYSYNDGQIEAALFYVIGDDKESSTQTDKDDDHIQLTVSYNF